MSDPDAEHAEEMGDHVTVGTVAAPVKHVECTFEGSNTSVDETVFRGATRREGGLFEVFYVWEPEAGNARNSPVKGVTKAFT